MLFLVITSMISLSTILPQTPVEAASNYGFNLRGAGVAANNFAPAAASYYSNAWQLLKDLNVNWIRVSGGIEGDVNHFNIQKYPNEWAKNLDNFLAQAASYGMKVSFASLGSAYDTLFGIRSPGNIEDLSAPGSYSYTSIEQAKAIIDQLAGNNNLNHNFIADPRVLGWVTSNEVYIGDQKDSNPNYNGPLILDWNLQLCDYIRSKGGKAWVASPTTTLGSSDGYDFAQTYLRLQGHVDFLEAHYYEVRTLRNNFRNSDGTYDWSGFQNYYKNLLTSKMVAPTKGSFPIDNIILGEFGMWLGQGSDFGLSASFTNQDRGNYYRAVLQAARDAGLKSVCQFDYFEQATRYSGGPVGNNYGITSISSKNYYTGEAADVLREAYGGNNFVWLGSESPTVPVGSTINFNGGIVPAVKGANVTLSFRLSGGNWNAFATVSTDSAGMFMYAWSGMGAGAYEVKASVSGLESSLVNVAVNSFQSSLSLSVSPLNVIVGSSISVIGSLSPVRSGVTVIISQRSGSGNAWSALASVITDSSSRFSYSFSSMTTGVFDFKASWFGDSVTAGAESSIKSVTVNPVAPASTDGPALSSVSVSVASSSVSVDSDIVVAGSIIPIRVGVDVSVYGCPIGGAWTPLGKVKTDSSGKFSFVWRGMGAGAYEIKANWQGDAVTLGAESNVAVVDVKGLENSSTGMVEASIASSSKVNGIEGNNGWFSSDVSVTLLTVGDGSDLDRIEYSYDLASWASYISPLSFSKSGIVTLYFRAISKDGTAEPIKNLTVKIDKANPYADAGGDRTVSVKSIVFFSSEGSVDDVDILSYEWSFGDGGHWSGENCTHVYLNVGTYNVVLTVTDAAGNRNEDSVKVNVVSATTQVEYSGWVLPAVGSGLAVATTLSVLLLVEWRRRSKIKKLKC